MDTQVQTQRKPAGPGRVAFASFIGTTVEWYDFFIYGTAAALVFNQLFFPTVDPLTGTLAAFATFAVGFVARPIGAVAAGHIGDRVGRKTILVSSLMVMGVATLLIGLLPTYGTIGLWAPLLLTVLRFCQGLGVGAEWGGAVLMATEHAPTGKRGFYGSWPQMGVPAGSLLATATFAIVSATSGDSFVTWGWRIPFLLSAVLVVTGLAIRLRLEDSPAFHAVKATGQTARRPVVEVLRRHPRNIVLAIGARFSDTLIFYIVSLFVLTYAGTTLGLPRDLVLTGVLLGSALELLTIPALGALSDRIGHRRVFLAGAAFAALFAYPFFLLIDTGDTWAVWLAVILMLNGGHAPTFATSAALLTELFPARTRMSGASVSYNISSMLAAAPAPIVATGLLDWAGGRPWPVALYMAAGALFAFCSVLAVRETFGDPLDPHGAPVSVPDPARRAGIPCPAGEASTGTKGR
ncbi:MFS transporter [Streptomyces cellulosae]